MEHTQTDHKKAIIVAFAAAFAFASIAAGASKAGGIRGYLTPDEVDFVNVPDYLSTDQIDELGYPTVSHVDQKVKTYPMDNVYFCKDPNVQNLLFVPPTAQEKYDDTYHGSPEDWYEYNFLPNQELDSGLQNPDAVFSTIVDKAQLGIATFEDVLYVDENTETLHGSFEENIPYDEMFSPENFVLFEDATVDDALLSELEAELDALLYEDIDTETLATVQQIDQPVVEHAAAPTVTQKTLVAMLVDEIARWFGVAR